VGDQGEPDCRREPGARGESLREFFRETWNLFGGTGRFGYAEMFGEVGVVDPQKRRLHALS
jgi:hypothetical protein